MAEKSAAFYQHSNTPLLQYTIFDRPLNNMDSWACFKIGHKSDKNEVD